MVEIVTNFQTRGEFDDLRKIGRILPYDGDLYRSYYIYDNDINLLIADGKDFTKYKGKYDIDNLIIDIDGHGSPKSMELAKEKVEQSVAWLLSKGVDSDNFLVWFSGGGFHIHIAASLFDFTPSEDLPNQVRDTMLSLFPEGDNIYYPRAIVRVGYSFNTKRKLWKVPLTLSELQMPITDIMAIAKSGEIRSGIVFDKDCFEPVLESYKVETKAKFKHNHDIDLPEKDNFINVVTCMHKLYDRGPLEGRRHTDMLRLASWMRRAHMPEEVVIDSLTSWAIDIPDREVSKIVNDVFVKDYRYGCNDMVRSEYCDPRCIFFEKKNEGSEVMSQSGMDDEMIQYAMVGNYDDYVDLEFFTGQTYKIYPGEFVVVTGETGVNKTTLIQQIATEIPDKKVLYISTEVDRRLMYRRFLQMVTHMDKETIMKTFSSGNVVPGSEKLSHIMIVDNVPTWERLIDLVIHHAPDVIMIDVIEDIGKSGALDNISFNAPACKAMAMQMSKIVIAVNHMRKSQGGFRRKTKSLDDSKGDSAMKQKADKMIMVEGYPENCERTVRSGKARDEMPFTVEKTFNPETFILE